LTHASSRSTAAAALRRRDRSAGQSVVEFALVVPILLFMLIAIADFGRFYTSAVAIESAAREAADFGAFDRAHWDPGNITTFTLPEMERRACVAAAGSHLQDYASSDPTNATCTNPSMSCTLEWSGGSASCATSAGMVGSTACYSDPMPDPACVVHVRLDFDFHTILGIGPLPSTVHLVRDSRFRVSQLAPP
jgi:hypothetical protein